MDAVQIELHKELDRKISHGNELVEKLTHIIQIEGVPKLQRKIKQEITFLKKLKSSSVLKKEQLSSSNLRHLAAVVSSSLQPDVTAVCKVLQAKNGNKVSIDIISENGKVWTKVIARNPKSLSALSDGNASYGARSILDQAQDYIDCAIQYPYLYQTPQIVFEFVSGIEDGLAAKLQEYGIIVKGLLIPSQTFDEDSDSESSDDDNANESAVSSKGNWNGLSSYSTAPMKNEITEVWRLNLDVTTMMAYVSNLTNGHHNFVYKQGLLSQQAIWESVRPVKPILDNLFDGKELVCCETAWSDFKKIVDILGGPNEKLRSDELKERLTVLPDNENGPDEFQHAELKVKGRIRLRSKIVFNFGQRIKALTLSANEGFVRSAKQQGITYAAIIHESRALTEEKEKTATRTVLPASQSVETHRSSNL